MSSNTGGGGPAEPGEHEIGREGGQEAAHFDTKSCWTGSAVLLNHALKMGFAAARTLCVEPSSLANR